MNFKQLKKDSFIIREQYITINAILGQNLDIVNNELKALILLQNELKNEDKGYFIKQAKETKESTFVLKDAMKRMNKVLSYSNKLISIDSNMNFTNL